MRPTSTNFHPAGLMSAPDMLAMADTLASDQAQCRVAYNEMDRSMLVVVTKSGEGVRETVVAANLPKCALGIAKMPRFTSFAVALSIIECNDLFQACPKRPGISFIVNPSSHS